jgi:hypothetical protein
MSERFLHIQQLRGPAQQVEEQQSGFASEHTSHGGNVAGRSQVVIERLARSASPGVLFYISLPR